MADILCEWFGHDEPTLLSDARDTLAAVAPAIAARALREAANDWDREDKARGFLVPGQASNRARARADRIEADA